MKNSLLFCILFFVGSMDIFAQAPQGLNYQAVAYDGTGMPVVNQSIGVRLSILDGSPTGTLIYQETQNPITDNTGLFSIVIGNGIVVSGAFNTINWGNGSKWLKTEIDITGGSSYVAIGTTQFMSVPYALYANTGGLGSPSFTNPDGFEHVLPVILSAGTSYIVPAGKNLYLPTVMDRVIINTDTLWTSLSSSASDPKTFIGVSENDVVKLVYTDKVGFLVDKHVDWKTFDLVNVSFTVPVNKQLVVINNSNFIDYPNGINCKINLNGTAYDITNLMNSVIDEGTVLSSSGCTPGSPSKFVINGYLKDK